MALPHQAKQQQIQTINSRNQNHFDLLIDEEMNERKSEVGWFVFLFVGGYGRQQAAKGSAKKREQAKPTIQFENEQRINQRRASLLNGWWNQ